MNITTNYSQVIIFTKQTNLSQFFWSNPSNNLKQFGVNRADRDAVNRVAEYYAKPRKVELILLLRWEQGKCYCKIKCPINPLPVRGEFEAPSQTAIINFLVDNGWIVDKSLHTTMLR